jgi:hypothetical protein
VSSHRFALAGYAPQPSEAVVEIEELGKGRRVRRALGGAAAWLGAGVVCVFIPIAHFVLVPFCLVMAFVTGMRRMAQGQIVTAAHGRCPDCGAEQELDLKGPWGGLKDLTCRQCQRPMRMSVSKAEGLNLP